MDALAIYFGVLGLFAAIILSHIISNRKNQKPEDGKGDFSKENVSPRQIKSENASQVNSPTSSVSPSPLPQANPKEASFVGRYVILLKSYPITKHEFKPGKIVKQIGKYVEVSFKDEVGTKTYDLQKALDEEILKFADEETKVTVSPQKVISVPKNSAKIEIDKGELPKEENRIPLWVNTNYYARMSSFQGLQFGKNYGSNSREIYLKGAECFGWDPKFQNEFAVQGKAMYARQATPEGYSVWFVASHRWIGGTAAGKKWHNTIGKQYIHEYWNMEKQNWDDLQNLKYDFSKRITFAKAKGGGYVYIGVFQPRWEPRETKHNEMVKVYEKVEEKYPPA